MTSPPNRKFYTIITDRHTEEILFEMQIQCGDEFDARLSIREEYRNRIKYSKKSVKLPLVSGDWFVECVEI